MAAACDNDSEDALSVCMSIMGRETTHQRDADEVEESPGGNSQDAWNGAGHIHILRPKVRHRFLIPTAYHFLGYRIMSILTVNIVLMLFSCKA